MAGEDPCGGVDDNCHLPDDRRCTARAKSRDRARCRQPRVPGRTVCRYHGGRTPRGVNHPNYRGRGRAKDLPRGLTPAYERAIKDPDALSLKSDVALWEVRIGELLGRLSGGESGALWTRLKDAWAGLEAAKDTGDCPTVALRVGEIGRLIAGGVDDDAVWRQLGEAINEKGRAAQREWRRLRDLQMVMPADRVLLLVASVMHSVKRHVTDRQALAGISRDIADLLSGEAKGG